MATLKDIAHAVSKIETNHSLLIYGPPKMGKTRLAGTAARLKELKRIFWLDLENGVETLLNMDLTDEELDKVTLIKIRDSRDQPIAIETVLKMMTSKVPIKICEHHGRVDCVECVKAKAQFTTWCLSHCTHDDLIVLDSGSQLGDSALAAACLGKPGMYKPTLDEYGMVNKWLGDVMSVIQQATFTNFVVITHEIALEDDEGKDKIFPLIGSKTFSMRCAKFFGTVAYVHKKANKHVAGSSSTYRGEVLTGSRVNAMLEKVATPDMRTLLVDSGILRAHDDAIVGIPTAPAPAVQAPATKQPAALPVAAAEPERIIDPVIDAMLQAPIAASGKQLTLKEKLDLKKQQALLSKS